MRIKLVFSRLAALLVTITFFVLDAVADSESASDESIGILVVFILIILIGVGMVGMACFTILSTRKARAFLKQHRDQLSSEDPKVLLELSEKCGEFLKDKSGYSTEVILLEQQAKRKATKIQKQIDYQENLATFKSEISKDGSHPRVISTFKEHMHNPDSFQHVSSEYEDLEKDGKHYYKITMTCRGTNTFGALVLHTYFFVLDEDNQISLIGSSDNTEASSVNMEKVSASVDAAVSVVEGVTLAADLLSFFSSNE